MSTPDPTPDAVHLLAAITNHAADSISDSDRLADLGVDSLDRVHLAVLIEQRCGRTLTDAELANLITVADLRCCLDAGGSRDD